MVAIHVLLATIGGLLAISPINAMSPDPSLLPANVDLSASAGSVPHPQARSRLKQTTRAEIVARQARKHLSVRADPSPQPVTCVPDSTAAKTGLRGAVFHKVSTSDSAVRLTSRASDSIQDCAQFCLNTIGCEWSYLFYGQCHLQGVGDQGTMGGFPEEDQFFYPHISCADQKAKQPGAIDQECCNLYY